MKKIAITTVIFLIIGTTVARTIQKFPHTKSLLKYGKSDIDDYKIFVNDTIKAGNIIDWQYDKNHAQKQIPDSLLKIANGYKTKAYVIIQNDKIIFENYYDNYTGDSLINSFSAAKTIVSLLMGCAIDRGYIDSINQPVETILKRYAGTKLTIYNLLSMSSGSNWSEQFLNPFSDVVTAYYTDNLLEKRNAIQITETPGLYWSYQCGNTLLLAEILETATGKKLDKLTQEWLWQPLGSEHSALWSTDTAHVTKSFCCFFATARDFARLGYLILNEGFAFNKYILNPDYIKQMTKPASLLHKTDNITMNAYGMHIWIMYYKGYTIPYARGMWGQYIFIIPEKNAVVVRLGEKRTEKMINYTPEDAYTYIDIALRLLD